MKYVGRFGTLIGFACQICAAGAAVIWPDQKWVGWSLFVFGGLTLAVTFIWWLRTNRAHLRDWVKRVEPVHVIALGLIIAAGGVLWMLYRGPTIATASLGNQAQANKAASTRKLSRIDYEARRVALNELYKLVNGPIRDAYNTAWTVYNEPPRQPRRLFGLSHAAIACSSMLA